MSVKAGASIEMSDGHGDFQAGNVLWDGRQSWIIDWEHSGRRQFLYDALVYALAGRSPAGSAARFAGFLACPRSFLGDSFESAWPEMRDATPARWQLILTVFLLEQLVWYIEENRNPLFRHPDRGLIDLCREFDRALQECST
jgi:Ser/Thr protein kinase RdoA (MazF antagonist)